MPGPVRKIPAALVAVGIGIAVAALPGVEVKTLQVGNLLAPYRCRAPSSSRGSPTGRSSPRSSRSRSSRRRRACSRPLPWTVCTAARAPATTPNWSPRARQHRRGHPRRAPHHRRGGPQFGERPGRGQDPALPHPARPVAAGVRAAAPAGARADPDLGPRRRPRAQRLEALRARGVPEDVAAGPGRVRGHDAHHAGHRGDRAAGGRAVRARGGDRAGRAAHVADRDPPARRARHREGRHGRQRDVPAAAEGHRGPGVRRRVRASRGSAST